MKPAVARGLSLLLAAALVATTGAQAGTDQLQGLIRNFRLVPLGGRPAPPFTLAALDGATVSLAELLGRPVLLYFWQST